MNKLQYQGITGPLIIPALTWIPGVVAGHSLERLQYQVVTEPVQFEEEAAYDPAGMEWLPSATPTVKEELRRAIEAVEPVFEALYKPEDVQWLPQGKHDPTPVERRYLGDSQPPIFDALYKPETLEWRGHDQRPLPIPFRSVESAQIHTVPVAEPYDPSEVGWLPAGRHEPTPTEERYLGDFASPQFEALYKPETLEWESVDSYFGRPLESSFADYSVLPPPQIEAAAYDPAGLEWTSRDVLYARQLESAPFYEKSVLPPIFSNIDWMYAVYVGQSLPTNASPDDRSEPFAAALYTPANLDWLPAGKHDPTPVEARFLGDFSIPQFEALYDAAGLEWFFQEPYSGKPLPKVDNDVTTTSPIYNLLPSYDPQDMAWYPISRPLPHPILSGIYDFTVANVEPIPTIPPTPSEDDFQGFIANVGRMMR